jgi:hypothetical protein
MGSIIYTLVKYAFAASAYTCKEKEEVDHCTASTGYWKVLVHSWNALVAEPGSSLPAKLAAALEASDAWSEAPVKALAKGMARYSSVALAPSAQYSSTPL